MTFKKNTFNTIIEKDIKNPFPIIELLFWSMFTLLIGTILLSFNNNNPYMKIAGIISIIFFAGLFYILFINFLFHLIAKIFANIKNHTKHYLLFVALIGVGLLLFGTYYYLEMRGIVTLIGMLFVGLIVKYWDNILKWIKNFKKRK